MHRLVPFIFVIALCTIIYSCQDAKEIELTSYITNGKDLYKTNCQNCHGANGEGLGELAPPLTDLIFLKIHKTELSCIIKHGSNEPMVINGKTYEGKMPAMSKMADIDVAQVIVYITNSFGNRQGMYTYEQVAKDLEKCR